MSSRAESLLARIEDPVLRAQVAAELAAAQGQRKFGLVFEHHLPETVRLPRVRPRRGLKVVLKGAAAGEEDLLHVVRLRGVGPARVAECLPVRQDAGDEPAVMESHPVADLEVVAEFGDPIYPGLTKVGETAGPGTDPTAPSHIVLNAENHHALQALQWSHAGAVDLIYIDPPYNTGNKTWQYNDSYVGEKDAFRHSKWLSFMEKRLTLARTLLRDTGVIIVAIGDEEHHRLRMLMDQVFGEQNFISDVVWQGGRKNDSRYISNGADYMLVYARNEQAMSETDVRWRERKPGIDDVFAAAADAWSLSEGDGVEATSLLKKWWKGLPKDHPAQGSKHYNNVCSTTGRAYFPADASSSEWRAGRSFRQLPHPVTGGLTPAPANGWAWSDDEVQRRHRDGLVHFGPTDATVPQKKSYLDEIDSQVSTSVFDRDRRISARHLASILGDKRFPNPKDHNVLMRWIRLAAPKDAVVLDFFGGSGTTAEAVVRLNAEDGGTRQSILVTNNELSAKDDAALRKAGHEPGSPEYEAQGVFHHVTRPRIETVVSGLRTDGSKYSDGLPGRVTFFDLEYLDADRIADDRAFDAVLPMLWMRAGAPGTLALAEGESPWFVDGPLAVLRDATQWHGFAQVLPEGITHAFVVTNSATEFSRATRVLPAGVEVVRLYEKYLTTFEINTLERAR